jgi:transcriptional regulator with XRE-family HTH domain
MPGCLSAGGPLVMISEQHNRITRTPAAGAPVMNETTLPINRDKFSQSLRWAIESQGLTYLSAANLVNERLPENLNVSPVSMWHYASGKAVPRRPAVYQQLCEVFSLSPPFLSEPAEAAQPAASRRVPTVVDDAGLKVVVRERGQGSALMDVQGTTDWVIALRILQVLREAGALDARPDTVNPP